MEEKRQTRSRTKNNSEETQNKKKIKTNNNQQIVNQNTNTKNQVKKQLSKTTQVQKKQTQKGIKSKKNQKEQDKKNKKDQQLDQKENQDNLEWLDLPEGRYYGKLFRKKKMGQGQFYNNNGDYYHGEFKSNKMTGLGVLIQNQKNLVYEGEFKNDMKQGKGKLVMYINAEQYQSLHISQQKKKIQLISQKPIQTINQIQNQEINSIQDEDLQEQNQNQNNQQQEQQQQQQQQQQEQPQQQQDELQQQQQEQEQEEDKVQEENEIYGIAIKHLEKEITIQLQKPLIKNTLQQDTIEQENSEDQDFKIDLIDESQSNFEDLEQKNTQQQQQQKVQNLIDQNTWKIEYEGTWVKDKLNGFGRLKIFQVKKLEKGQLKTKYTDEVYNQALQQTSLPPSAFYGQQRFQSSQNQDLNILYRQVQEKITSNSINRPDATEKEQKQFNSLQELKSENSEILKFNQKFNIDEINDMEFKQVFEYSGGFQDNKRHGACKIYDVIENEKFIGEFRNDNKFYGELKRRKNKEFYIGQFKQNQFHGQGRYQTEKKDSVYVGNFVKGKKEGFGKITYRENHQDFINLQIVRYEGNFKNNLKDGQGIIYKRNGRIEQGIWENGILQYTLEEPEDDYQNNQFINNQYKNKLSPEEIAAIPIVKYKVENQQNKEKQKTLLEDDSNVEQEEEKRQDEQNREIKDIFKNMLEKQQNNNQNSENNQQKNQDSDQNKQIQDENTEKKIENDDKKQDQQQEEEQDTCSICYGDMNKGCDVKILICKHVFHPHCIDIWLKMKNTCPVCKVNLKQQNQHQRHIQSESRGGVNYFLQHIQQINSEMQNNQQGYRPRNPYVFIHQQQQQNQQVYQQELQQRQQQSHQQKLLRRLLKEIKRNDLQQNQQQSQQNLEIQQEQYISLTFRDMILRNQEQIQQENNQQQQQIQQQDEQQVQRQSEQQQEEQNNEQQQEEQNNEQQQLVEHNNEQQFQNQLDNNLENQQDQEYSEFNFDNFNNNNDRQNNNNDNQNEHGNQFNLFEQNQNNNNNQNEQQEQNQEEEEEDNHLQRISNSLFFQF